MEEYLIPEQGTLPTHLFVISAPITFVCVNLFREQVQLYRFAQGSTDKSIMYWYSAPGALCAVCIIIFCFALIKNENASKSNRAICFIASYTFSVFLFHITVRNIFNRFGVQKMLQARIFAYFIGFAVKAVYSIVIIGLVFLSSFSLSLILRALKKQLIFF